MFGSVAFMVNGKMCVAARSERIMCRIDPALHDDRLQQKGCTSVVMRGRECRGYIHIQATALATQGALQHWIRLALEFNKHAKPSRKKAA